MSNVYVYMCFVSFQYTKIHKWRNLLRYLLLTPLKKTKVYSTRLYPNFHGKGTILRLWTVTWQQDKYSHKSRCLTFIKTISPWCYRTIDFKISTREVGEVDLKSFTKKRNIGTSTYNNLRVSIYFVEYILITWRNVSVREWTLREHFIT